MKDLKTETIDIEIRGLYDGICVKYYRDTDEFIWRGFIIDRTTEEYRKEFEENFRKQFKQEEL